MLKRLRAQPRRIEHETKSGLSRRPAAAPVSAAIEEEVRRRTVDLEVALEARSRRLREFDHLAKNNLQTLASIILLKARRSQSAKARRSLLGMAERITALSTAHRLLDPADPAGGFDVGAFVKDFAGEVAAGVDPRRIAIRLDLRRLEVAERDAAPIALLINELVTNALRHAFPDERRGHVAIAVGAQGRIVVADNGVGLGAAAPSREAFGRSLAEMLARQIGAELVFEDARPGTRADRDAGPDAGRRLRRGRYALQRAHLIGIATVPLKLSLGGLVAVRPWTPAQQGSQWAMFGIGLVGDTEAQVGRLLRSYRGRLPEGVRGVEANTGRISAASRRSGSSSNSGLVRNHIFTPRCSATVKMSLSPRPQRFITIRWSFGFVGASSITLASACAGSSAGMMPSSAAAELERLQRLVVGRREVGDAADVVQPGMLGADAGIVEAGRDRVRVLDLAVVVHQEVGAVAVQHAGPAAGERGGVQAASSPWPAASTPKISIWRSSRNGWNSPMAFEPPPIAATSESGRRPSACSICSRVSRPMTHWKSRTIAG